MSKKDKKSKETKPIKQQQEVELEVRNVNGTRLHVFTEIFPNHTNREEEN